MSSTSRDLVHRSLRFQSPERIPRDIWLLPWAEAAHPDAVADLARRYPSDIVQTPSVYIPSPRVRGDPYALGLYTDEWGCTFVNIQAGAIGEIKEPILRDLTEWQTIRPPYETLPPPSSDAVERVNRFCSGTDRFVLSDACPRPWERYQFLRGSGSALMDMARVEAESLGLLRRIHEFYLQELEFWVATDVDGVRFMDDWGAQDRLLISPGLWREIFKPMYREYCELAHSRGKFIFMHTDGNVLDILPDLVEVGVDAMNSQLFCMDIARVASVAKGKVTFWGEIDRQHILPSLSPEAGRAAVRKVARCLYDPTGGVIAQVEFGLGAHPPTVAAVFDEWTRIPQEYHNLLHQPEGPR